MVVFLVLFAVNGSGWAAAPFNRHLYNSDGALASGTVLDRDGEVLSTVDEEGNRVYSDSRNPGWPPSTWWAICTATWAPGR